MKIIFTLLIALWSTQLIAQFSFSGKVIDNNKKPISFANVTLLNKETKNIYKGGITEDDGSFSFNNITANTYEVVISFIGYKEVSRIIKIDTDKKLEPIV